MTGQNPTYNVINPSHSSNSHRPQSGDITGFDVEEYSFYVRYARTGDEGSPCQFHRLHHIDEPIPVDADFASPVYLLNDEQVKRHERLKGEDDRFWVRDHTSIAIALQDECEEANRVLYPLFIESDAEVEKSKMRAEIKRFIREVLEVDPNEGRWYFSGGQSLHVHLPYYVESDTGLQWLRNEAKAFNEETEAPIDPSNYSRKSLFRLPGAEHHRTGTRKLPVSPDSSDKDLQKKDSESRRRLS